MSTSPRSKPLLILVCGLAIASVISGCGSSDDDPQPEPQPPAPAPPPALSRDLYVFGDSLSDTGNLGRPLSFGQDLPPPFYQNRISNGPVIVEYVGAAAGQPLKPSNYLSLSEDGTNYAIAGAKVIGGSSDIDLSDEVESFTRKNGGKADPADNYLFFIGGNDIISAVGRPDALATLDAAAIEYKRAMQSLIGIGARRFFVLNVPDIGRTPQSLAADAQTPGSATQATALTQYFNAAVATQISPLAATPGVSIVSVDVYSIFQSVFVGAAGLGFTDTTRACYVIDSLSYNPFCNETLIDTFFFFDKIHPSARTHRAIGEEVVRRIAAQLR